MLSQYPGDTLCSCKGLLFLCRTTWHMAVSGISRSDRNFASLIFLFFFVKGWIPFYFYIMPISQHLPLNMFLLECKNFTNLETNVSKLGFNTCQLNIFHITLSYITEAGSCYLLYLFDYNYTCISCQSITTYP